MWEGEGVRYETLFRDETVGALDNANGKEYVRMLRRAMDLGGFHQIVFICHTPLVWELADQILTVGNGHVVVGNLEGAVSEPPSILPPLAPNNGPDYHLRPGHFAGNGVYAPRDSLARIPCLSARPEGLIL